MRPLFYRQAAQAVWSGGVIAYPTEAVFGLGCNPLDQEAVYRLLAIKKRPVDKGLIIVAHDIEQLRPFMAPITELEEKRLTDSWPGPVTWLVPTHDQVPHWLTGEHDTLAMRVTKHPVAAALCQASKMPLVSTSANLSGQPPTKTRLATQLRFGLKVDYIVPGAIGTRPKPSEIRDLVSNEVIRAG